MEERRKFNRWYLSEKEDIELILSESNERVKVLDLSAGGAKILSSSFMDVGKTLKGKLKLSSLNFPFFIKEIGPYFVEGEVTRAEKEDAGWKIALKFNKVSTLPFS